MIVQIRGTSGSGKKKHGTFQEFEAACWKAYMALEITKAPINLTHQKHEHD